jgi:hypothetical protein
MLAGVESRGEVDGTGEETRWRVLDTKNRSSYFAQL